MINVYDYSISFLFGKYYPPTSNTTTDSSEAFSDV